VIFIYVTSLASSEIFSLSTKVIVIIIIIIPRIITGNRINPDRKETARYETIITENLAKWFHRWRCQCCTLAESVTEHYEVVASVDSSVHA
jgi:hypothetical protein